MGVAQQALDGVSAAGRSKLAGNAMHGASLGAVLAWVAFYFQIDAGPCPEDRDAVSSGLPPCECHNVHAGAGDLGARVSETSVVHLAAHECHGVEAGVGVLEHHMSEPSVVHLGASNIRDLENECMTDSMTAEDAAWRALALIGRALGSQPDGLGSLHASLQHPSRESGRQRGVFPLGYVDHAFLRAECV